MNRILSLTFIEFKHLHRIVSISAFLRFQIRLLKSMMHECVTFINGRRLDISVLILDGTGLGLVKLSA